MTLLWCHEINTSEDLTLDVAPGNQKLEIVRRYHILSDTMDDSSITACSHNDLPTPFSVYSKGNDYNANLVATTCRAKRDREQPLLWHVDVGYTDAVNFDQSAPQSGSADLTCFLPSARSWKIPMEKVIWRGRLQLPVIAGTGNTADTFATTMAKSTEPIANSVNKLFADGIVTVKHARAWEIRRYEWYFNETQADDYTDVVNSDTCWDHDPGTVKMVAITGDRQTVNNALVWLVTYEFHIYSDGWGEDLLDNGMERWCTAAGGTAASIGSVAGQCLIKDHMGEPISSPVLLDGKGYVGPFVSAPVTPTGDPVVVTWHHLEQATFGDIQPPLPSKQALNIL